MKILDRNSKKTALWIIFSMVIYVVALLITTIFSMHNSGEYNVNNSEGGVFKEYDAAVGKYKADSIVYHQKIDSINDRLGNNNIERLNKKIQELEEEIENENIDYDLELEEINSSINTLETKLQGCDKSIPEGNTGGNEQGNTTPRNTL